MRGARSSARIEPTGRLGMIRSGRDRDMAERNVYRQLWSAAGFLPGRNALSPRGMRANAYETSDIEFDFVLRIDILPRLGRSS